MPFHVVILCIEGLERFADWQFNLDLECEHLDGDTSTIAGGFIQ